MSLDARGKNRLIYSLLLILCIVGFWCFENFYRPDTYDAAEDLSGAVVFPERYYPAFEGGELVKHPFYVLSYSERHEQAAWVGYTLSPSHLSQKPRKRPYFVEDPKVSTHSAAWWNYKGSGYDRGHLCPAADRRFSETAFNQTFYTSNISPQVPEFNAGIWNDLEKQIRRWCRKYGDLYVITGGVLSKDLNSIGEEQISVPDWFYKVVFRGEGEDLKVMAFLLPNKPTDRQLSEFRVPISKIESLSGINFYATFSSAQQHRLESAVAREVW